MSTRKPKWHSPPPPSPRILHLARRTRRPKTSKPLAGKPLTINQSEDRLNRREKLETLFDEERTFARTVPLVFFSSGECEKREKVESDYDLEIAESGETERWRFQAEILRAECSFLRMEREIAVKKSERNRLLMERALRSILKTLISGRSKICEGRKARVFWEEEIEDLEEGLEELQKSCYNGDGDVQIRSCSNFDKQASILQKRFEKIGVLVPSEVKCVREIQEMAEASLSCVSEDPSVSDWKCRFADVEILRRKMKGFSKGMLERLDEYRSMEMEWQCSGRCKAIVRGMVEQVRAEADQWSQMQGMLGQIREEMEELQASRDFWEDRALESDHDLHAIQISMEEWRQKARISENKVLGLQKHVSDLHIELERLRALSLDVPLPIAPPPPPPPDILKAAPPVLKLIKGSHRPSESSQNEKEKRVLICRLKENSNPQRGGEREALKENRRTRSPLGEFGNSLPLYR